MVVETKKPVNAVFLAFFFAICLFSPLQSASASEFSIKLDANTNRLATDFSNSAFDAKRPRDSSMHLGFSLKRSFGQHHSHYIGTGIDFGKIIDDKFIGFRAVDYEYLITSHIRLGTFLGAASLNSGLPQNGYYMGFNASYIGFSDEGVLSKIGLRIEQRYSSGLSRDREDFDPERTLSNGKPDIFTNLKTTSISAIWFF